MIMTKIDQLSTTVPTKIDWKNTIVEKFSQVYWLDQITVHPDFNKQLDLYRNWLLVLLSENVQHLDSNVLEEILRQNTRIWETFSYSNDSKRVKSCVFQATKKVNIA